MVLTSSCIQRWIVRSCQYCTSLIFVIPDLAVIAVTDAAINISLRSSAQPCRPDSRSFFIKLDFRGMSGNIMPQLYPNQSTVQIVKIGLIRLTSIRLWLVASFIKFGTIQKLFKWKNYCQLHFLHFPVCFVIKSFLKIDIPVNIMTFVSNYHFQMIKTGPAAVLVNKEIRPSRVAGDAAPTRGAARTSAAT